MKTIFIIFALIISLFACKGQTVECEYPFMFEIESPGYTRMKLKPDTVYAFEDKGRYFMIVEVSLSDCEGEVKIEGFAENEIKVLSGNHIVDNQVRVDSAWIFNPVTGEGRLEIREGKMLLKHGEWSYWDTTGIVVRKEYWENGIIQEVIKE